MPQFSLVQMKTLRKFEVDPLWKTLQKRNRNGLSKRRNAIGVFTCSWAWKRRNILNVAVEKDLTFRNVNKYSLEDSLVTRSNIGLPLGDPRVDLLDIHKPNSIPTNLETN